MAICNGKMSNLILKHIKTKQRQDDGDDAGRRQQQNSTHWREKKTILKPN